MITSMILSGGPLGQSYDFMSPSSKIQLEEGFSEQMSQRGSSMLGRDPYLDMVTTLPLTAVGATEADAWNAYNTFVAFAQRIAAFPLSPDRNPIIFGYKTISSATLMYTLCLGTPDGNPRTPIVSQPSPTMLADAAGMYRIRGFKISFRRKGRFIAQASTDLAAVTAGTTNSPLNSRDAYGIFPADFDTDSPLQAELGLPSAITSRPNEGHWLISNPHTYGGAEATQPWYHQSFFIYPGNQLGTLDATYTTVVDAVANSYPFSGVGATLSRWQATDNTAKTTSGLIPTNGICQNFLLLATVRSDVAVSTSTMQFFVQDVLGVNSVRGKVIPMAGDSKTKIVNCGTFSIPLTWAQGGISGNRIGVIQQNTSAALSRVWIDELIIVNLDVSNLAYVRFGPMFAVESGQAVTWYLDPRYLEAAMPEITGGKGGFRGFYPTPAWGNMHMSVKSRRVRSLFLGVGSNGAGAGISQWRWLQTNNYTVTYRAFKAGLIPLGS